MSHKEILEIYIDLEKSCVTDKGKKEVMDMLYNYKEAFSLRDEIGTCPNIDVEIDATNKSPFFIRPCHVKFYRQRNEVFILFRYIEGRSLSLLQISHVN